MQRDINVCGCEFRCDYEWDDKCLALEGVSIDGNDLTDLITDKVTDKIRDKLYEYFHEDLADLGSYYADMKRRSMTSPYITMQKAEVFPQIGANATDDGEVIISLTCYPVSSMMTVSMGAAIELANKILRIANERVRDAA